MKTKLIRIAAVAVAAGGIAIALPAMAGKDTLVLGIGLEPPHLDPTAGAAGAIDEVVYANIMEGLTRIDQNGVVKPALAESWAITDDGLTYTFKLRQGVKFHDGSTFDSSDVVFSIERAMAKDSTNAQKALFKPIKSVKPNGANSAVVTLNVPTGQFLFNMGWGDAIMVDPKSAGNNKTNPIGTGPFKFKRWVKGDRIEIERADGYWGTAVKLKSATFKIIPDPAAAMTSMMAGDIDAFTNFPAPESIAQFKADSRFTVVVGSTEGETILSINNGHKPFNDVRVRRAIAHALDRKAIVDGAMFGFGTPIGTHFAPHHPAYVDLTDQYPHDPAKAKKLLAEAGYKDGFKTIIKLPPPAYARRSGEIIAAQLAKVGIKAELVPVEWAQWLEQVFRGDDFDLTIISHTEPLDIGIYARDKYYFNYKKPAFKAVIDELGKTTAKEGRYALMSKAQKILAEDSVNGFLFQLAKIGVWNAKLKGLWKNSPVQANDLTGVSWSD